MNVLLIALCGAMVCGGLVTAVAGLRRTPQRLSPDSSTSMWRTRITRLRSRAGQQPLRVAAAAVGGVVLFAITGWPLMLVLAPIAAVGLPVLLSAPTNHDVVLLQALDRWVRALAATLPTGKSVAESVRITARQAPEILRDPLALTVLRMDDRWSTEDALHAFADGFASPDADAVVASLVLAAERGGTGATATLTALSENIADRLRALREIETERAKPRIVVRQVTIITLSFLAFSLLTGRAFFEPYGTPVGQLVLAVLIAMYVGSLVILRRMTIPRSRDRILSRGGR